MKIEWRDARTAFTDLGNAQPNLGPHLCERIGSHARASWLNGSSRKKVNGSLRAQDKAARRLTESAAFVMGHGDF
jgi:hypothetical protein